MKHVVLAVSYMSELLEREMRVQEERVRKRRHTDTLSSLCNTHHSLNPAYFS